MIIETKVYSCRRCQSEELVKNGTNASGSSQYHCKACGAYGVLECKERATEEKKELIMNVYQKRSSMRGIERTFGVSRRTLSAWLKEQANDFPPLRRDATTCCSAKRFLCWRWMSVVLCLYVAKTMYEICLKLFIQQYNTELLPIVG